MAKIDEGKTSRTSDKSTSDSYLGVGAPTFEPFIQAGGRFFDAWIEFSNEMLEFSRSRIDQTMEFGKAITQTSSLNEALDLQAKHTRAVMQDYISEANKMVDFGTRSLLGSLSHLQQVPKAASERAHAAE